MIDTATATIIAFDRNTPDQTSVTIDTGWGIAHLMRCSRQK